MERERMKSSSSKSSHFMSTDEVLCKGGIVNGTKTVSPKRKAEIE